MKKLIYILLLFALMVSACKKNSTTEEALPEIIKPVVTSIQPKNPKPGDVVTITGSGFGVAVTDVKVNIGTQAITITSVTATEIKFTLPAGLTEAAITIAIKDMAASITDPQGATIKPQPATQPVPTFTALSPATGKAGDVVTLTGTNFSTVLAENLVKFTGATTGTTVAATVKTATTTTITVEVPATVATGVISIEVKGSTAVMATGFAGTFTLNAPVTGGGTGTLPAGQTLFIGKLSDSYVNKCLTTDAQGNVYVIDQPIRAGLTELVCLNSDGVLVKRYKPVDYGYAAGEFTGIVGVATDKSGVIHLITSNTNLKEYKIFKITAAGGAPVFVRNVDGRSFSNTIPEDNMTVTSTGDIFFKGHDVQQIYKIDNTGKISNYLTFNDLDAAKTPTIFDISMDQNDNLYIAAQQPDGSFKAIYKYTPAKVKSVIYSSTVNAFAEGTLTSGSFKSINTLSVSPDGSVIYVGDYSTFFISKIDIANNQITKIAGAGAPGTTGISTMQGASLAVWVSPYRIYFDWRNKVLYNIPYLQKIGL